MDKVYLSHYRDLVCRKFKLGEDSKLRQREFEYLSDEIEKSSGIRLSISTLKRIWRDDTMQLPHMSTLNALVSLLDYTTWVEFKQAEQIASTDANPETEKSEAESSIAVTAQSDDVIDAEVQRKPSRLSKVLLMAIPMILTVGFLIFNGSARRDRMKSEIPKVIPFSADKTVTMGVPNTVQFKYDLTGVKADSFFIQQSWDPRNKERIDPSKKYFSSIYYLPGFHRAKLIVDDAIVARARIHIKTDGWFSVAKYDQKTRLPFYLDSQSAIKQGVLHIDESQLTKSGVDITKPLQLRYYNIRDFDDITSDNFVLEARVKSDSSINVACPLFTAVVVTEEHIFFYPLTLPGCVGALAVKSGETYLNSRQTDLSAFGCNVYDWQTLRIENVNKSTTISLNGKMIHQIGYKNEFGKIVGLMLTFNGPAAVDEVKLSNGQGKEVFTETFDKNVSQ